MLNPANELIITPFRQDDMPSIFELEQLSFRDPYPWWLLAELARKNPDTFLVAKLKDQIVGYAIIDEWEDHGHLVSIAVHPNFRRTGIATGLLQALEEGLRSDGTVRLEVRESNDAAIQFYLKHGFEKKDIVPGYYADGENAITMEKETRK
jgi:[ribosomal protein S18]-alanine N-acetyltransferase